ncbi:helix-turn-helix domain-containing protein [Erythrobacter sp. SCSIO 43205]|uniref:helix-turn-helix domain-containing protein n=1 Tax=Erythrobacter sp. SCSIO 43205 TaxID=2779361 RepID=UPI001CA9655F|nr:helix-turn-helix domain-containing protein [Erythrobacter sp. SCSIO 43205]UAB78905.1 helix-turn-helix domain-containing protein [Erythrobacter sp. SCSIO 43205]
MTFPELFERFATKALPLNVSDATHLKFQAVARYASAREGDAPFKGNGSDQIIFIARGSTKLVAQASQGREQIVAFNFEGDMVSVPAKAAHVYSLIALEDCELIYFPAQEFFRLAQEEAVMISDMLDRALKALARCREKTIALGRKTAGERIASFLISMAERIGDGAPDGITMELPMSRRDIADSLGLTIETVSRQLTDLRSAGIIQTPGRSRVVLTDMEALKARAGHLLEAA